MSSNVVLPCYLHTGDVQETITTEAGVIIMIYIIAGGYRDREAGRKFSRRLVVHEGIHVDFSERIPWSFSGNNLRNFE